MQKSNTEIHTNTCSWKNQADWEILAFVKNQADWKILAFVKNQADWEILAFVENQADWEILAFTKNQADLWNPCVYRKSGRFVKSLRLQKIRQTIESLRVLKSPRLVKDPCLKKNPRRKKNQRDWENRRPAYCSGSAESPTADFSLVWLMSSRSDPPRCDYSRMQSPSEEKAQAALLLWAALLSYCTGCLYRPAMPGNGSISCGNQKLSFRLKFHRFLSQKS
jgi:hypothetical protein